MRAVLDSNVLISASIRKGPAHRIVQARLERGSFELVICQSILDEVTTVLVDRDSMRRWISAEDARLFVERLSITADVSEDPRPGLPLTRNPDDDFVVYLARENDSDWMWRRRGPLGMAGTAPARSSPGGVRADVEPGVAARLSI